MKICLVSPYDYFHPGGVSEHVRHLAESLRRRQHEVTVMAPSSRVSDDHGIPGYVRIGRSVPIRANGSVARVALSFHLVRRVRGLLDREAFDIVHYHEPLVPSLPITVLRFHQGANVGTFHTMAKRNLGYYYARPFLKRYFNRLHARIAVSAPARDFASRYFPGEYTIVPNGIDTGQFAPNLLPPPEIAHTDQAVILFVGRLEKRKGFGVLLDAYRELRQRRSDVRLVCVGDGPLREEYEAHVVTRAIPDVLFAGRVSDEMKARYFSAADIYCAPNVGGESFGIVLLEAMASGTPVLASAIEGFTQVINAGVDGILVPPKQPKMWAQAIEVLLNVPELRQSLGAAGLEKAKQFDWDHVTGSILEVYEEARQRSRAHEVATRVYG